MKKLLFAVFISLLASTAAAQTYYVREGAGGSGSSWSDAYSNLPATLVRGATYYFADGSYGGRDFDTPGTATITFKKARSYDHGTDVGWQSSYGDGQAIFTYITLRTNNYVFDGNGRNESNWADGSSYGFRITWWVKSNSSWFAEGTCSDNIVLKYCDIGGAYSDTYSPDVENEIILGYGAGDICNNWTIQRNILHNANTLGQMNGVTNWTWEYNHIENNWGKTCLRGQNTATNVTIRYNMFKNTCRSDGATESCTAEIGFYTNFSEPPNFDGAKIYGNVFWTWGHVDQSNNGTINAMADAKVYNNTIATVRSGTIGFRLHSTAGSVAQNNIIYNAGSALIECSGETCDNNTTYTSNPPFVNMAGANVRLTQAVSGISLDAAYNRDLDGNTRGEDGVWDRGAFEFGGTPQPDLDPPYLSNASPSGTIACVSDPMTVTESIRSDEPALVRYSTTNQAYDDMTLYSSTGVLYHSRTVRRACGASYLIYSRGMDGAGNKNTTSTVTSYTISEASPSGTTATLYSSYSTDVNSSGTKFHHDGDDWVGRGSSGPLRVVNQFGITGVNPDWTVTKVEHRVYVESKTGSPGTISAARYGTSHGEDNAQSDAGSDVYTKAGGTEYATLSEPSGAGWSSWIDLGSTAITDLEWCADNEATTYTVALRASAEIEGGETQTYLALSEDNSATRAELRITYTYEVPVEEGTGAETTFISGTRFGENATSQVKNVTTDKYITSFDPTLAFSSHFEGFVRTYPAETCAAVLQLKFDLSSIPTNATVSQAVLYLYLHQGGGDEAINLTAHKTITTGWDTDSTWTNYDWSSYIDTAETTRNFNTEAGWRSWTVTAMVEDWVATPASNLGLIIASDQGATHAAADTYRGFLFSEYTDTSLRPFLVVSYTTPSPGNKTMTFTGGTLTLTPGGGTLTFSW
jgi:hypothetical protein